MTVWTTWLAAALLLAAGTVQAEGVAMLLEINGSIGPATSDYIGRGLEKAAEKPAELVILRLDTPGGLDIAMRQIVQDILSSPVPVVTYVSPSGARAASAGTYILYASHIAAMAPGTNVGAATPVQIGGKGSLPRPDLPGEGREGTEDDSNPGADKSDDAMTHKIINDASAWLRSLAQLRGRNQEWAGKAVREAASLPAEEALSLGVIDILAEDQVKLLSALDGRKVSVQGGELTLNTGDLQLLVIEPDWRTRLLSVIADPNIAYILVLIGIYGLIFEFYSPGFVLPGVIGAICLLLALFALQVLPVNYAGLALLVLGIIFMVSEAFMPSFGALGIGGLIAFVIGSVLLIDTDMPGYGISLPLILSFSAISAVFFFGVVGLAIKARKQPVVSGKEELTGATGIALNDFSTQGRVQIHGESWLAKSGSPVKRGQQVYVTQLDGLTLQVEPKERD